jgi:hypothetical protein
MGRRNGQDRPDRYISLAFVVLGDIQESIIIGECTALGSWVRICRRPCECRCCRRGRSSRSKAVHLGYRGEPQGSRQRGAIRSLNLEGRAEHRDTPNDRSLPQQPRRDRRVSANLQDALRLVSNHRATGLGSSLLVLTSRKLLKTYFLIDAPTVGPST